MPESLLFKSSVTVSTEITLHIPTLEEILEFGEEKYFSNLSVFIAQPFTYMGVLDDMGIDYEKISEFDLFLRLAPSVDYEIIPFLFGDTLPLIDYSVAMNNETKEHVLVDPNNLERTFTAIDLRLVADAIRAVHFYKKETHKAGNAAAKEFMIERAKRKAKRAAKKPYEPYLEPLIISMVNSPEFPYSYSTNKELTIYQFMCSVLQIPRRIHYDNLMHGVYVGMIKASELDKDELNWMTPKLEPR